MKLRCRLGWHDWSPWRMVPVSFNGQPPADGKSYIGGQVRNCVWCVLTEVQQLPCNFAWSEVKADTKETKEGRTGA